MVYAFWKILMPIYRLWIKDVVGIENVQKDEPFIIAVNHTSYYDTGVAHTILVPVLDKKIHALVNSYYWKIPIVKSILDNGECIPVFVEKDKDSKKKNELAFEKALKYLKKKELIMIFPEGKRSPDGKLQKAYHGTAKLALKAKVPVLPVGIIGSYKVLPKGKMFPRFKRCEVKIGKPIYFNDFYNKKINNKILENITKKIMKEIAKLIGQEYNN